MTNLRGCSGGNWVLNSLCNSEGNDWNAVQTRRYPWGIQWLVSTYSNHQNPKCQDLPKIQLGGGVLESQNTQSAKICLNFNLGEGAVLESQNTKSAKIYLNFHFGWWGDGVLESQNTQSAKICLNFNWGGGSSGKSKYSKCQDLPKFPFWVVGGWCSGKSKYSKCQDLPKFPFWVVGGWCSGKSKYSKCQDLSKFPWGGVLESQNTQSTKICLNYHFGGESKYSKCQDLPKVQFLGGCVLESQNTQSAKIWLNFIGGGGVLEPNPRTGVFWRICSKISGSLACWCITDSLSHTTYVETNNKRFITPQEMRNKDVTHPLDGFNIKLLHLFFWFIMQHWNCILSVCQISILMQVMCKT